MQTIETLKVQHTRARHALEDAEAAFAAGRIEWKGVEAARSEAERARVCFEQAAANAKAKKEAEEQARIDAIAEQLEDAAHVASLSTFLEAVTPELRELVAIRRRVDALVDSINAKHARCASAATKANTLSRQLGDTSTHHTAASHLDAAYEAVTIAIGRDFRDRGVQPINAAAVGGWLHPAEGPAVRGGGAIVDAIRGKR